MRELTPQFKFHNNTCNGHWGISPNGWWAHVQACKNKGWRIIWHAHCRNLPFGGRATQGLTGASSKKGKCAESSPTFIRGKCRKNRKRFGLQTLIMKGLGVFFTHGEGLSTPRVCYERRQPFNQVCKYDFKMFYFPFFVFLCFYAFYVFYLFVVN